MTASPISDLNPLLLACGATLTLVSTGRLWPRQSYVLVMLVVVMVFGVAIVSFDTVLSVSFSAALALTWSLKYRHQLGCVVVVAIVFFILIICFFFKILIFVAFSRCGPPRLPLPFFVSRVLSFTSLSIFVLISVVIVLNRS